MERRKVHKTIRSSDMRAERLQERSLEIVVLRTPSGWHVKGNTSELRKCGGNEDDAVMLSQLLSVGQDAPQELTGESDEDLLRFSVLTLERALESRIVVEQAIGVLAERWGAKPLDVFQHLRRVASRYGYDLIELARVVVNPAVSLADIASDDSAIMRLILRRMTDDTPPHDDQA